MLSALNPFARAAAETVASTLGIDPALLTVGAPPKPALGDFAVGVFPAAKLAKQPPPVLAKKVADAFTPGPHLAGAVATGPFVNFRADRAAVIRWLFEGALGAGELVPQLGAGQTVCIDYSSPNISKHLAYHHIRSTVIGHALHQMYAALGYQVVGINHLGDWGTTHGMLLAAYQRWGAPEPLTVTALNDLYVRFRAEIAREKKEGETSAAEEEGRAWFKKLEDGDPEARALWQRFRDVSLAEFREVYDLLGVRFDEVRGESEFEADMPKVLALLDEAGLAVESEGALVVELEGDDTPPLLLRKRDGATTYATRDLAAAIHRWERHGFARSLYVVDRGQSLHFQQLFEVLRKAGFEWADRCQHVPFGLVRMGGKKTGTRSGQVILLREVLAEAQERVAGLIRDAGADLDDRELADTARQVGVGAVVFFNLSSARTKDVDFTWDAVLNLKGDSGPYIQYGHARTCSVLRKASQQPAVDADVGLLAQDAEWELVRKLIDFGEVVARATDANEPHHVSRYLLDLCALYSRWYTLGNGDPALRITCDDPATQRARVSLAAATQRIFERGLALLGLEAPQKM